MQSSAPTPKKSKLQSSENLKSSTVDNQTDKLIEQQSQKLAKNQQRLSQLQQRLDKVKQERAQKTHELDNIETQLKQCREHKEVLPLIQQLRQHYKKLKAELGSRFYFQDDDVDVDSMSYEQLMELSEKIGKVSKGLTQEQFKTLQRETCAVEEKCSICQDDLVVGTECIRLKCGHRYDVACLEGWFKMEKVCPLCKSQSI